MPSPEIKKNITSIGILLLPLVVVKIAGAIFGGPSSAEATTVTPVAVTEAPAAAAASAPIKLSKQQLAAIDYIATLRTQPFGPCPLLYDKVEKQPEPVTPKPEVKPPPVDDATPKFILNAIMTGSSRKALINNRPYTEGSTIRGTEWTLTSIDAPGRAITLTEKSSGKSLVIRVDVK